MEDKNTCIEVIGNRTYIEVEDEYEAFSDEYSCHRKAMEYVQEGKVHKAKKMLMEFEKKYPDSLIILSELIRIYSGLEDFEIAEEYIRKVKKRYPVKNWKAVIFDVIIDHYLKDASNNESEIRGLITDYKNYFSKSEAPYVFEYMLENKLENRERYKAVLQEAIDNSFNASKSAVLLTDVLMKEGDFDAAKKICEYYDITSCEVSQTTEMSVQLYQEALIEDALVHKKKYLKEPVTEKQIQIIEDMYKHLLKNPKTVIEFGADIDQRLIRLKRLRWDLE